MVTVFDHLDDVIQKTARETAIAQGLPPVLDDPVALAPVAAAVGDYFETKSKSGTKETDAA